MSVLLVALLAACFVSDKLADETGPGGIDTAGADGGGSGGGEGGAGDDTGDWWEDPGGDADGDGWTADEGDCDDGDDEVNPGVSSDECDDFDNDCDGRTDEDFDSDPYEPNDDEAYDLGDMGDEGEALVYGYVFEADDEDRFTFYVEDSSFGWFSVETWLYNVPDDADYALELIRVEDLDGDYQGTIEAVNDSPAGGDEVIDWDGESFWDDSGWYEVVVSSVDGSSCHHPYTLQVLVGGW